MERQHPKKGQPDESHTCKCGEKEREGTWDGTMEPLLLGRDQSMPIQIPISTLYSTTHDLPVKYKVIVQ